MRSSSGVARSKRFLKCLRARLFAAGFSALGLLIAEAMLAPWQRGIVLSQSKVSKRFETGLGKRYFVGSASRPTCPAGGDACPTLNPKITIHKKT
jgi:hypothetical protein